MALTIGDSLPVFDLPCDDGPCDDGTKLNSATLKGKILVLYFYPKDDTSGCTKEALAFEAQKEAFTAANAQVIGVSKDSPKSHGKFKEKYDLSLTLISDEDASLCEIFGVWAEKSMYGRKYMGIERSTFIFNKEGLMTHEWRKVKVPGHAEAVLKAVQSL